MLEIRGPEYPCCDGINRRSFLRVGFLGLAGLSLADHLRLTAAAQPSPTIIPRERFCALASGGKLVAEPGRAGSAAGAAQVIDFADLDGAKALTGEACP